MPKLQRLARLAPSSMDKQGTTKQGNAVRAGGNLWRPRAKSKLNFNIVN